MKYNLTVLHNLLDDPVAGRFFAWRETGRDDDFCLFLRALYGQGAEDDFSAYLAGLILYDVNAFSVACAGGKEVSPYLKKAFLRDAETVRAALAEADPGGMYCPGDRLEAMRQGDAAERLRAFYAKNGYGDFCRYRSFKLREGTLVPIRSPSEVKLADLKEYVSEKKTISSNIECFLAGLPYSNMLLYGARGTGKSSTVHAMLNRYFSDGLRLIELQKENMLEVGRLKESLRDNPLRFLLYIDDLTLDSSDERISSLKALLEGGTEGYTHNTMIVVTSNYRHIVDEKFSQRDDSVHAGDVEQEELSLSDRFGISLLFATTNKQRYLSIVDQLLEDMGVKMDPEETHLYAERWAICRGGRSPRMARQFADLVYSCVSRGVPIEF